MIRKKMWIVVVFLLSLGLLVGCDQPESPIEAFEECIDYAMENAEEAYDNCIDRADDRYDNCMDHADNDAEEEECEDRQEQEYQTCERLQNRVEREKRDFCARFFNNNKDDWSQGTNEQREAIKKEAIKGLTGIVGDALKAVVDSFVDAGFSRQTERASINGLALSMIPEEATVAVSAWSVSPGEPIPGALLVFPIDPGGGFLGLTLSGTQVVSYTGLMAMVFEDESSIEINELVVETGNLQFGVVDSPLGINLDPYNEGSGFYDQDTGAISLTIPLVLSTTFVPSNTAFIEVHLKGLLIAEGGLSYLSIESAEPVEALFQTKEEVPPLSVEGLIGPEGGELFLDEVTGLTIPWGMMEEETDVRMEYVPSPLLPPCPVEDGTRSLRGVFSVAFSPSGPSLMRSLWMPPYQMELSIGTGWHCPDPIPMLEGNDGVWQPAVDVEILSDRVVFFVDKPGLFGLACLVPTYTLTTEVVGEGAITLDPSGGVYLEGSVVTATAVPTDNWSFIGWSGAVTGTTNPVSLTLYADEQLTATFEFSGTAVVSYTLTTSVVGNGAVTRTPSQTKYISGTMVALEAIPEELWSFRNWSGHLTGAQNPDSLIMDGDKTVIAIFDQWRVYLPLVLRQ